MGSFEDIPEDRELSYPCEFCDGEVEEHLGEWSCDTCGFRAKDNSERVSS